MTVTRRLRLAAVTALAVAALSGCVVLPPPLPTSAPPTLRPQPQPTQTTEPTETVDPADFVQPDEPVTTADETDQDTGDFYAGEPPITSAGYSPDAATDVVLEPTRGQPRVAAGAPFDDTQEGNPYLPDVIPSLDGDLIRSTVGRLEMTDDEGGMYTCSGTVINSGSQNIVITAAHCVFNDDTRSEMASIEFVPAYDEGDEPFGRWQAEDWWYPQQYITANDRWLDGADDNGWMGFDFAYLRLAPNADGEEVEDVVGAQGVPFTAETNGVVLAGYPANDPFDGEVMRYCVDGSVGYGLGGDPNYGIECEMGSGASGSGWVSNVDPETGAGTITAVYSNGGTVDAYGPPLGITAYNGLLAIEG